MKTTSMQSDYFFRESLYNLVELALLARFFEESCVPAASGSINKASLSQTLLKMKATEGKGQLRVAIHGTDPVGFFWLYEGKVLAHWVHPDHKDRGVEQGLLPG